MQTATAARITATLAAVDALSDSSALRAERDRLEDALRTGNLPAARRAARALTRIAPPSVRAALDPQPPLDLTRTRAALAAYDAAGEFLEAATTQAEATAVAEAYEAARAAVGDAFAADTADRNRPEVARLAGVEWIRALVADQPS